MKRASLCDIIGEARVDGLVCVLQVSVCLHVSPPRQTVCCITKPVSCMTETMWSCLESINRQLFNISVWKFKAPLYIQHPAVEPVAAVVCCDRCFQSSDRDLYMVCSSKPQTGWQSAYVATPTQKNAINVYANARMQSAVHILSHQPKEEKMEWEEVKGIEWVAVGEKDGERGRGRVGVSGTWLSV